MVFGAPCAKRYGSGIFYGFSANSKNFKEKQNGIQENLEILWLQSAQKTHICAFSMIWATFCTHQNHCYLCVLFSSQPQSSNFEQNFTRYLHLSPSLPKWEGHIDRLESGKVRLLTGVKGCKFETSSTKDTRYSRDKWSAFTRLKFQQNNL